MARHWPEIADFVLRLAARLPHVAESVRSQRATEKHIYRQLFDAVQTASWSPHLLVWQTDRCSARSVQPFAPVAVP